MGKIEKKKNPSKKMGVTRDGRAIRNGTMALLFAQTANSEIKDRYSLGPSNSYETFN